MTYEIAMLEKSYAQVEAELRNCIDAEERAELKEALEAVAEELNLARNEQAVQDTELASYLETLEQEALAAERERWAERDRSQGWGL